MANELGAGSGRGARFAIIVSITTSVVIALFFWCLILYFNGQLALLFTSSEAVLAAVKDLSVLLDRLHHPHQQRAARPLRQAKLPTSLT